MDASAVSQLSCPLMVIVLCLTAVGCALTAPFIALWLLGRALEAITQAQEAATQMLEQAVTNATKTVLAPQPAPGDGPGLPATAGAAWVQDDELDPADTSDPTDAWLPDPMHFRPEVRLMGEQQGNAGIEGFTFDPDRYAHREAS